MRLALVLFLVAMAGLVVAAWWARPLSVARGLGRLDVDEGERLKAVLRAAAIPLTQVRFVETTGEPCSHQRTRSLARWLRLDRSTQHACVGIREGQVESLRLTGAALRELAPLAELAALRHAELRGGDLERIGRLPKDCRWETLDVSHNRLRQLEGLEVCTALTTLDVSHNRLRALPVAALADLETLDASGNPTSDLSPFEGLDRLKTLSLRGLPIFDASSIPSLPALERLELARTDIARVDADTLARWPRLQWLGLEATPLMRVNGAYDVDRPLNHPTLLFAKGLRMGVNETPLGERLGQTETADHDGTTRYHVDALPRGSGRWQGARRQGRSRTGFASALDVTGSVEWMTGAQSIGFESDRGLVVTVHASVETGRLRMYLAEGSGYVYAEAIPGRSLTLSGPLITGTSQYVMFAEAVGGRAEGIRWSVRGTS